MLKIEKKTLKVGKHVNKTHVEKVTKNYKQERWAYNSEKLGKEDSLSAWWSIEELEEFMAEAKRHGADGMKFYYAAYDESTAPCQDYIGLQTLVMVGTRKKEVGNGKTKNKDLYVQTTNGSEIVAYNCATICPPYCQSGNNIDTDISIYLD